MSPGVLADGRMLQGGGWQLRRISFVAARHPDAHSISPENLGLVPLNESVEVRRPNLQQLRLAYVELLKSWSSLVVFWLAAERGSYAEAIA